MAIANVSRGKTPRRWKGTIVGTDGSSIPGKPAHLLKCEEVADRFQVKRVEEKEFSNALNQARRLLVEVAFPQLREFGKALGGPVSMHCDTCAVSHSQFDSAGIEIHHMKFRVYVNLEVHPEHMGQLQYAFYYNARRGTELLQFPPMQLAIGNAVTQFTEWLEKSFTAALQTFEAESGLIDGREIQKRQHEGNGQPAFPDDEMPF